MWKSTSAPGAPDISSPSHFSAMTRPSWLGRAVRNRHRHAIEQASRRWRGGRRDDSARTRRKILISTQPATRTCFSSPSSCAFMAALISPPHSSVLYRASQTKNAIVATQGSMYGQRAQAGAVQAPATAPQVLKFACIVAFHARSSAALLRFTRTLVTPRSTVALHTLSGQLSLKQL